MSARRGIEFCWCCEVKKVVENEMFLCEIVGNVLERALLRYASFNKASR